MVEVFDAVTKGEAPTISAQPKQQFDDNPAINRLAQEWSQRDFRRYQKYLVDHMRHMRDIGWTDTAEAALSQLSVDPTLIGRVGTTFNSFEGASVSIKDGRYLVVVRNAKVVEARDVAGSCVINGDDPMNVYTFLREFVPAANIPVALEIVSQRAVAIMKRGATVPTSQDGTVPSRVKL